VSLVYHGRAAHTIKCVPDPILRWNLQLQRAHVLDAAAIGAYRAQQDVRHSATITLTHVCSGP